MKTEKITRIVKKNYVGKVYNLEVEPNHPTNDDQYFVCADTGIVIHNCHPRDNIALRWLSYDLDLGYDLFDAIMHAREVQARNMAEFLASFGLPVVIVGKTYKPDVPYMDGSASILVGHFVKETIGKVYYMDPIVAIPEDETFDLDEPATYLIAHSGRVTYGTDSEIKLKNLHRGSVIVDPWRQHPEVPGCDVIHYGNTRRIK